MRVVPEFSKKYGLLNKTSLKNIVGGLFVSLFFTVYRAKSKKMLIFKVIITKISPHSIKHQKLALI
jgi:hypothetical protein